MNYCVDWLSFTLPVERGRDFLNLHFFDVQHLEYGGRGYTRSAIVYGSGRVYWHPDRPEMGVHFDLSASCLAAWFADWESHNPGRQLHPKGVIFRVLAAEGHFTRIDIAWDDTGEALDLDLITAAAESGEVVSRWRSFRVLRQSALVDGAPTGLGVTFGSRSSDAFLRIYDKRLERLARDADEELPDHWIRVECEFKRERAQAVALLLHIDNNVEAELASILYGYLDFKIPNSADSNRRRWQTAAWWLDFLCVVSKSKLLVKKVERTLADVVAWLDHQVAPLLAVVSEALSLTVIESLIAGGKKRWKPKHKHLLAGCAT